MTKRARRRRPGRRDRSDDAHGASPAVCGCVSRPTRHRHARRQRTHQFIADRTGGARHLVDGQPRAPRALAPQRDLAARPGAGTGVRSTAIMSIDTRPTVRVRTPSTSTGVPVGHSARVAVGIAAGDDADAHRRVGREAAAVADAVAGLQRLHGDQPRAQRHRRAQAASARCRAADGRARCRSSMMPARTQSAATAGRGGVAQRGGAVAQACARRAGRASRPRSGQLRAAMPRPPSASASAKCVISEISSTCGSAFSRAQALR